MTLRRHLSRSGPGARRAHAALALAIPAVLAALAGCSLFEPRDPETGGGPTKPCPSRSAPDSLIAIVQQSYGDASNLTCYPTALDASFAFHPDPADSIEAGDVGGVSPYANWNQEVETRDAQNIAFNAQFAPEVVFDSLYAPTDVSGDGTTQTRHYAYHLLFQSKTEGGPTRYQGLSDITLRQGGDGFWTITVWVDKRDASGSPTWGRLRRVWRTGF